MSKRLEMMQTLLIFGIVTAAKRGAAAALQGSRAYRQAAKTLGYSHARIMFRHILPNVAHIILIQFSIRFPSAVSTEVFISFLGIGVQGEPSWGVLIHHAFCA